jgi:hypothetical protein
LDLKFGKPLEVAGNVKGELWDESVELKWLMEIIVEKGLKEDGYCGLGEIAQSL